jgi:hypothetical protein
MPENPGKDLALSEPFMQFGQVLATIGRQVQTGDVPQTVLDAFDYVKSHLQSGGKQVEDAYETLKKHADKLSQAIVPKLHAQESEQAQAAPSGWTPETTPSGWTPEGTTTPMNVAKVNGQDIPVEDWRQATGKGQVIFSNKVLAAGREALPAIGGTVGQVVAGPAGAAAGGLTGERLRQYGRAAAGVEPLPEQLDATGRMLKEGAVQGGIALGSDLIGKGLQQGGEALYRSVLKPSLAAANIGNADEIVARAIKEGFPITRGGEGRANALIGQLKNQVTKIQAASPDKTDLHAVADELRQWATGKFYKPGVPSADFDAAMKVADNIDHHASLAQTVMKSVTRTVDTGIVNESGQPMTRTVVEQKPTTVYRRTVTQPEAQAVKSSLQNTGADASLLDSAATKQANEAGGHFMRVAMEKATPAIAPLNARESQLIDTAQAINRAVQREANQYKTIQGTRGAIGAVLGGGEYQRSHDPWSAAAIGLGTMLALQPGTVSRVAIIASRLGRLSSIAPASAARIAYAAVQANKDSSEEQK